MSGRSLQSMRRPPIPVGFSGFVSVEIGGPPERSSVEASAANVRRLWAEAQWPGGHHK